MIRAHPEIPGLVDWQPLARGGFSTVWVVRQESLDRLVAVKIDHRPLNEDSERRRFLREAGAAGRLSGHPGIVTVHDAGILADGRPYLVMDLCPGGSLTQWLKPQGRQSQSRIRDVGVRIADALAAAHARGVLHRDVKPANILIDAYDHPGLADFGLAALPEPETDPSVTLEGMTPAYAAKEVFYRETPTEFGDVYSLAATLYALLDGKPPRWPDNGTPSLPEILERHRHPIERLPRVDRTFMDVLLAALSDDPHARPTAAQFRDQLAALALDEQPCVESALGDDATLPLSPGRPIPWWRRRSPVLLLIAAAVVLVLMLIAFFNWGPSVGSANPKVTSVPVAASTPAVRPSSPRPASPTVRPAPSGFVDCSPQLGGKSFCLTSPECWSKLDSYRDTPLVAEMEDCDKSHAEQTFAAGKLKSPANRQSQFLARKEVMALCSVETLNKVLAPQKALKDWKIDPIPPQINITSDDLFRCLFNIPGGHKGAVELHVPTK